MKKIITLLLILIIIFPVKSYATEPTSDTVTLSNCVDGNSSRFMLGLGEVKVKFLGIEVEEIIKDETTGEINETFISDYVCSLLKGAEEIKIEYEPNTEKEDKFGRIQAWVFVDGNLLQEELVKIGYAKVMYLDNEFLYAEKLKEAQNYAKENRLGVWKDEIVDEEPKEEEPEKEEPKGFFSIVLNFIGELFNKLIKFIDDIISKVL